jgi:hypothetical protein
MTTAREIVKKSLQKLGVLIKSESPSADEANDGLSSLNQLVDSWSNDSSSIPSRAWETFTLTAGVSTYTMSSGLTFNSVRPTNIIQAYVSIGGVSNYIGIINDEAYNAIPFKTLTGVPEFLNYDNAYPTDNIHLYPVPASAYPLFILSEKPLTSFATLDTAVSMPPGWERALIYNLALELAPEYDQQPDPSIVAIAAKSLGLARLSNIRARPMDAYPQGSGVKNIYSGWRTR